MNKRIKKINPLMTIVNIGTFDVSEIVYINCLQQKQIPDTKVETVTETVTKYHMFFIKEEEQVEKQKTINFTKDVWGFRIFFKNGQDLGIGNHHEPSAKMLRDKVIAKWHQVKAND